MRSYVSRLWKDHTLHLWNAETGELKKTLTGHTDLVASIAFSPDGTTLASGSNDKTVRLWDAETGQIQPNDHRAYRFCL